MSNSTEIENLLNQSHVCFSEPAIQPTNIAQLNCFEQWLQTLPLFKKYGKNIT